MIHGSVDFVAVEFKSGRFNEDIFENLMELVNSGIVRIIDLVVVIKDEDGEVMALELEEVDENTMLVLDPLTEHLSGMATVEDIAMIGAMLDNDSRAAMIMFENLWTAKLRDAVSAEGGRLLMHMRIPDDVVRQAWEDMSEI